MAQRFVNISLQSTVFPMLHSQQGRTVLVTASGNVPTQDLQVGVSYCHNVMPTQYGMKSVGYLPGVNPASGVLPAGRKFQDARVILGDGGTRMYLAWDDFGSVYALLEGSKDWISVPATSPATGGAGFDFNSVTTGTVNGVTYISYANTATFTYNEVGNTLDEAILVGLSKQDVIGVVDSYGYLVAYTKLAIAWSSTILPTDFIPSQVTGAGGGNVQNIRGDILFVTSNSLGLLVYSATNVVAATYSGSVQYPWKFKTVTDSKGGISLDKVAYEANSAKQFVFSKAGLQTVSSQKAETFLPTVTDFLAGKVFEDFNEVTKLYEIQELAAGTTMLKAVKYIAARYLIVSYGISSFTHALVWDTSLQKAGKLRIDHVDVFEYVGDQAEIAKESIGFLLATGEVRSVDFSTVNSSKGVLILGKVQYSNTRMTEIQGVEAENIQESSSLEVLSQASLDGKTFTNVIGVEASREEGLRTYSFRHTAKSHTLVFIGEFDFVTALMTYVLVGRR